MVDVGIDSEEPLEDDLRNVDEVLGEGNSERAWEDLLVVELVLNPGHQEIDIF